MAETHSRNARVPEATDVVHYVMRELVCAGTFDGHGWVSESTSVMQEGEDVMGRELDYEICIACSVQWWMLWLSAPTRSNQTLEDEEIKSRSTTKLWTWRSHGLWRFAHANVHVDNGRCGLYGKPHKDWDVKRELKGCGMEGSLMLLPFVDDGGSEESDG